MSKTVSLSFRFNPAEKAALYKLAEQRGVSASVIVRRLVREAVFHGPTFFGDELSEIYKLRRELSAIGNNLNQIARRVHSGHCTVDPISLEMIKTLLVNYKKVSRLMSAVLQASKFRRAILRKSTLTKPKV
ncbi:MAG: plasmid mobilization relaxosome protein MobC [Robiginitomaculum sp.]|nr:plasmid mobilization relaxosome protein MobC [Robiginitomaculum sp.]